MSATENIRILTNTAVSIDGRISTDHGRLVRFGSVEDAKKMSILRNGVDAVLVGGNSFRNYPYPLVPNLKHIADGLRTKPLWNVVVSRSMNFTFTKEFLADSRIFPLFLTNKKDVPAGFPFPVVCCDGDATPEWIVDTLKKKGITRLLIEGGGDLIFQFLKSGLVDEMFLTLCPVIIGIKGAPSLADGKGFGKMTNLKLKDSSVSREEIFLHYEVKKTA